MSVRLDRLTVFAHLWAVATLSSGLRWVSEDNAWGWPMLITAIALLFRPRSLPLLGLVMLTKIGFVIAIHPFTPNHILYESFLDVTLIAILAGEMSSRRGEGFRERVVDSFAPVARISLLVLYFFTVLHKLNRDFLDPDVSCGPALLELMSRRYPVPTDGWVTALTIWGTLAIEAAIPILICFARTRRVGIALGILFHFTMAQLPRTGLYSFTTMMFGLYVFFLPPSFFSTLSRRRDELLERLPLRRWAALIAVGLLIAVGVWAHGEDRVLLFGLVLWNVWFLLVLWLSAPPLIAEGSGTDPTPIFRSRRAVLYALPLVVILNGMSPYLGLKTLTSYAMLSNLRTEGGETNHMFMRRWISLTGYQDDLVEIVDTDHPGLLTYRDRDLLITYFELRRLCSEAEEDFHVRYVRNGESMRVEVRAGGTDDGPEVTQPHPWWRAKVFGFRAVDAGLKMGCRK